jgi:hypothetical protein
MKKISMFVFCSVLTAMSVRADVLFEDATNYPYTNGCIEGQGQWYCYSPTTPSLDVFVTNNVLLLTANSTNDSVATPTNGWVNSTIYTYASFTINVSQLPSTTNGGYFCQLQNNNDTNECCNLFIDTLGTVVPGTYRLGIANFATSFAASEPPNNYPMDLATNTTYNVVILFDNSGVQSDPLVGATLWINPSEQDFEDAADGIDDLGNFAFGTDTTVSSVLPTLQTTQIGFSPYINAGISNVMAATTFDEVNATNPPVIGIQPQPGTNYSGNSTAFSTVASGVDLSYQWFDNEGMLVDDGVNIIGSTSNILVLNNLSASDVYYVVVTDAYAVTATSSNAVETIITTPTAPYFPTNTVAVNLTNNLFTYSGFTNIAYGTGPLYYQWYFAPTATPNTYSPLSGQTSPGLSLDLVDYTYAGNYYVVVSNSINGGSIAVGPTNSLTELAPLIASMLQLHNFLLAVTNQYLADIKNTLTINSNKVIVAGYVVDFGASSATRTYGGYGSSYTEFWIEDASGLGVEVYLGNLGNTNCPPVGTSVTVTGPLVVYEGTLEIEPATQSEIVINSNAPPITIAPRLFNGAFNDVITNLLGTNAILYNPSLVTFTNVYIYGTKTGGALGTGGTHSGVGGLFASNNTYNILYFTIGQYSTNPPVNTNYWEIFQPNYYYGTTQTPVATNNLAGQPIPTHCYQLTGVLNNFEGTPELTPSRLQDYVAAPPSTYTASVALTNIVSGHTTLTEANVSWPAQPGSTYSVYTSTNLLAAWTQAAYGLTYYPSNSTFTDTNFAPVKFYRVSSP